LTSGTVPTQKHSNVHSVMPHSLYYKRVM
jgi:hypothetical protein